MAYGIGSTATVSATAPVLPQNSAAPLSIDCSGNQRVRLRSESVLGDVVANPRLNQVEVNFGVAGTLANPAIVTQFTSNGGSLTQATGMGIMSTGTNAAGTAQLVSVQSNVYRPGHEWYAYFSAVFTLGVANSFQRIGAVNTPSGSVIGSSGDGFYVGYEGTVFNFTQVQNGVNTHVPQSSWNGDPLNGTSASAFTANGVPVVFNPTLGNVYRIHGAWFGFGSIALELFSPDGVWIIAHTFTFPNLSAIPYAYTNNFQGEMGVGNTGNTSNVVLSNPCICIGTTDYTLALNNPVVDQTDAQITRAVLTGKFATASTYLNVGVDSAGDLNTSIASIAGNGIAIARPGVLLVGIADGTAGTAVGSINAALKVTEAGALNSFGQVSVTSAATSIIAANASRKSLTLSNPTGGVTAFIGSAAVTAATGFALNPGQTITINVVSAVFGITASTSQTVSFIEVQ